MMQCGRARAGVIRLATSAAAGVVAFGLIAGCGSPEGEQVRSKQSAGEPPATESVPASQVGAADPPQTGPEAKLAQVDLERYGFKLENTSARTGSKGNPVFLDLYVGAEAKRESPSGLGVDDLYVNAAYVQGLGADAEASISNLLVPRGAKVDGVAVKVGERNGLLVREDVGRYVVVAQGDWRIQVSTSAPVEALSDDALIQIADKAAVR